MASSSSVDADGLIEYCINFVADLLERPPENIDSNEKFSRIGFDSAMAVQLILALEERLSTELSPDLIETYPTITRLSAHLAERYASRATDA